MAELHISKLIIFLRKNDSLFGFEQFEVTLNWVENVPYLHLTIQIKIKNIMKI